MSVNSLNQRFSQPNFIESLIAMDHSSIEALVKAYTGHLYNAAMGMGFNSDESSELVQNTWETLFDILPNFKGNSHIRTFIFGVLYNKARELKRERFKFNQHEQIDQIMEDRFQENGSWKHGIIDPERFMVASQTLEIINDCVEKLPLTQKMAFSLKEINGEDTTEICNTLDISVTNLGVLLFRAKNRLRECIERKVEV